MTIRFAQLDKFGLEGNRVIRLMQAAPWKDQTFISRMPIWESAVNAFKQAPLLGNGPESFPDTHAAFVASNYEYLTNKYGKRMIDSDTRPAPHAHNMYFMQLAESGAFGLLLFLTLLLSPLVSAARNRKLYGTIVPILGFMVLVGLFECPFYGNFSAAFNITVTFMCLGYFAAIKGDERSERKLHYQRQN